MSYIPAYIIEKLSAEDIKFLTIARTVRQPEFMEMLFKLQIDEGISVKHEGNVKYSNIYMTAKRYAKILGITVSFVNREKDTVVIRKK